MSLLTWAFRILLWHGDGLSNDHHNATGSRRLESDSDHDTESSVDNDRCSSDDYFGVSDSDSNSDDSVADANDVVTT